MGEADGDDADGREVAELKRLHRLGIPVPAVEIRVDKQVATVWLESLEVESSNRTLRDRIQTVIDEALESVAPLSLKGT